MTGSKTVPISIDDTDKSVRSVLERFVEQYPRAETHLFDEDRTLRGSVRVLVDGERADPELVCSSTAEITLIPAAQGG